MFPYKLKSYIFSLPTSLWVYKEDVVGGESLSLVEINGSLYSSPTNLSIPAGDVNVVGVRIEEKGATGRSCKVYSLPRSMTVTPIEWTCCLQLISGLLQK
ncbi:MAG: hypothetical protein ACYSR0_11205 [Planctomycetota bacterium]|jgi:hypothetical protein